MTFENLVRGKSVCLVGPADSTEGKGMGEGIESFDLIARFGRSCPPANVKDLGKRTDIILENFWGWRKQDGMGKQSENAALDTLIKTNPKIVRNVYANHEGIEVFKKMNKGRLAFSQVDESKFSEWYQRRPGPSKGICGILDLLSQPIKRLWVVGMTFHKTSYHTEYINRTMGLYSWVTIDRFDPKRVITDHQPLKELDVFIECLESDDRLSCDDVLFDIIKKRRKDRL